MKILHVGMIAISLLMFGCMSNVSASSNSIILNSSKVQEILSPELIPYLVNHGYAIVPSNTTEWFLWHSHFNDISNYSDIAFTGDVVSKNIVNVKSSYIVGNITSTLSFMEGTQYITGPPFKKINYTLNLDQYTIHVDKFLKNPQTSNNMTIREPIVDPIYHSDPPGPRFNIGDHVLFYVKNFNGSNAYSQNSFIIPDTCNATDVFGQNRYFGSDYTMTQNGIKVDYNISGDKPPFTANLPIQFMYSSKIDTLSGKYFAVRYDIVDDPSFRIISSKEINVNSKKCEWMESADWELSLKSGKYYSNIYIKNDDGTFRQTASMGFSVIPNATKTLLSSSQLNHGEISKSPEFPYALSILLIGFVSVIVFYRIKIRK
ncbi:exported protein of unknown function [Nitrosotalea devaniterrae]|uniref:Uncharacterized protein n=1 Tax=Nitrosotalea devaniterrae TaxID=1078905 RepID=A0A128A215_9ARCH|nr:exported protein of unknown function [Candidatus Nitrosotalea devanaterra]